MPHAAVGSDDPAARSSAPVLHWVCGAGAGEGPGAQGLPRRRWAGERRLFLRLFLAKGMA